MPTTITILYPSTADAKFDMTYYLSKHMPLVQKTWGPEGLKAWKVLKFPADAAYSVQATLEFDTIEDFQKAASGESAKVVFGDVANFSNQQPTVLTGEVLASEGAAL